MERSTTGPSRPTTTTASRSDHNIERLTVLKHCFSCGMDTKTHELQCSCGHPLITVTFSALDGRRITPPC